MSARQEGMKLIAGSLVCVMLLSMLAVLAPPCLATSVVSFGFESLCRQADSIAYVRCVGIRTYVAPDGQQVVTETRLQVVAPIKGTPGAEITLTLPGGTAGERRTDIPGIPRFAADEEAVVFFTKAESNGSPWPMGLQQGCYRVQAAEEGERWVTLGPGANPVPDGLLPKPAGNSRIRFPLDAFVERIQRELSKPPSKRP